MLSDHPLHNMLSISYWIWNVARFFYIGCSTDCMAVRWRNHKSHIKKSIKSCELASHFIALSNSTHKINKSNQASFTSELSEHVAIVLIESVKPKPGLDVEATLKEREDFWQGALKSTPLFGGINKRSNRSKSKKSWALCRLFHTSHPFPGHCTQSITVAVKILPTVQGFYVSGYFLIYLIF